MSTPEDRLAEAIRRSTIRRPQVELLSDVQRCAAPDTSPEDVLRAVQAAFDNEDDLGYWQASKVARRAIRDAGWTPGNDFGQGRQYQTEITSAHGQFWLRAIMPRKDAQ